MLVASGCPEIVSKPLGEIEVTPSRTAAVTRRPKPEIRVHYRTLHEDGLIERKHRISRPGGPEHAYELAPRVRSVLEAISAFALPDSPEVSASGDLD